MPYIGNTSPSRFVSNRAASVYSGDGSTTAFTLEQAVVQDEDILVSVDGVVQEPSVAYAVSNATTLTFTAAPSSNAGNNIFVYYLASQVGTVGHPSNQALNATTGTFSGAITGGGVLTTGGNVVIPDAGNIGSASDTDAMAISSGGVVNFTQTPTYASTKDPFMSVIETWYYGTGDHTENNNHDLDVDWSRLTSNNIANKNGGMTESNGHFTFPSTGIWNVILNFAFYDTQASNSSGILIMHSTDSGSNFTAVNGGYQAPKASGAHAHITLNQTFNVTNASTTRILFRISSGGNISVRGGSGWNSTKCQFIKLCPSV